MEGRRRGRPSSGDPSAIRTEQLLDAALDAFAERGYDGMSVRELARDLGISHNLIPQRIGRKDELWGAAVDHGFVGVAAALATVLEDENRSVDLVQLRALVVRFIEANAARPALLRIINQEAAAPGPRLDLLFERYIEPVRAFGAELLGRLHANGEVRTSSVALVYFLMTHGAGGTLALPGLADRFGERIDPSDADAVHRYAVAAADVIFDGLLSRTGEY